MERDVGEEEDGGGGGVVNAMAAMPEGSTILLAKLNRYNPFILKMFLYIFSCYPQPFCSR